jgi:hypothetical protein
MLDAINSCHPRAFAHRPRDTVLTDFAIHSLFDLGPALNAGQRRHALRSGIGVNQAVKRYSSPFAKTDCFDHLLPSAVPTDEFFDPATYKC